MSGRAIFEDPIFRSIAESSPVTMMLLDLDQRIEFIVRPDPRMTLDQILGHTLYEFVDPSEHRKMQDCFEKVLDSREVSGYSLEYVSVEGDVTFWETRVSAVVQSDAVTGFICFTEDVTRRRSVETQLRQAQKMEAVGQLAGGIAHDFNNLMLAIMGNNDFARCAVEDPEVLGFLDNIDAACHRAAQLTAQLLTFSRRQEMRREPVQLNDRIASLESLIARLLPSSHELDFIAGHRLPLVEADPTQMEQVLVNLCLNARDAMPAGGRITIETETILINGRYRETHPWARPGRYVLLSVSDNGEGMSPEVVARAFEPFFTTKEVGKGSGLGLATTYAIVERHEGFTHLYSEPDVGTTVKVYLPVAQRLASDVGTKHEADVVGRREVVLVSEDEPMVRGVVVRILERAGFEVVEATNGFEAFRKFRNDPDRFACAVLDIVTPELSGPEAYERMREVRDDLPAVFVSGYTERSKAHAFEGKVLSKPFAAEDLLRRVREAIGEEE